jgi:hypothetical protein
MHRLPFAVGNIQSFMIASTHDGSFWMSHAARESESAQPSWPNHSFSSLWSFLNAKQSHISKPKAELGPIGIPSDHDNYPLRELQELTGIKQHHWNNSNATGWNDSPAQGITPLQSMAWWPRPDLHHKLQESLGDHRQNHPRSNMLDIRKPLSTTNSWQKTCIRMVIKQLWRVEGMSSVITTQTISPLHITNNEWVI